MLARQLSRLRVMNPVLYAGCWLLLLIWGLIWLDTSSVPKVSFLGFFEVSTRFAFVLGMIFNGVSGLFFQWISQRFELIRENFYIPFIFLWVSILAYSVHDFLEISLSFLCFLLFLYFLLPLNRMNRAYFRILDIGMYIGLLTFISLGYTFWAVLTLIALPLFGHGQWRSFVVLPLGILLTYFLSITFYLLMGWYESEFFHTHPITRFEWPDLSVLHLGTVDSLTKFVLWGAGFIFIGPELLRSLQRASILKRRIVSWGAILLVLCIPLYLVSGINHYVSASFLLVLSFFLSSRIAFIKKRRVADIYLYIIFLLVLLSPFYAAMVDKFL